MLKIRQLLCNCKRMCLQVTLRYIHAHPRVPFKLQADVCEYNVKWPEDTFSFNYIEVREFWLRRWHSFRLWNCLSRSINTFFSELKDVLKDVEICPGSQVIDHWMPTSISATKCSPHTLTQLQYCLWQRIKTIKVMMCPPNCIPQQDKTSNLNLT